MSRVYASRNESGCEGAKVRSGWVRIGTRSGIDGDFLSSIGYKHVRERYAWGDQNARCLPELLRGGGTIHAARHNESC